MTSKLNGEQLSGRELSTLVAERIFQSPRPALPAICKRRSEPKISVPSPDYCWLHIHDPETACEWEPCRFAEDVGCAMQVVEKMWKLNWQMEAANGYKLHEKVTEKVWIWYVRFIDNDNDMNSWSAEADTLPEAICLAALRAVESSKS